MKGSYLLLIKLHDYASIKIGAMGKITFKRGYYIYVGSAMGKKGSTTLLNRVKRHNRPKEQKATHWHIDYLLNSKISQIIQIYLIPSSDKIECYLASRLEETAEEIIPKFGCSDCSCVGHLFYFSTNKGLSSFLGEG
jgi:Uri superfamily endonuclease